MTTDLPTPLPLLQFDDPIIVIDVESTGLDVRLDEPVEVAWYNLSTGERGEFVPQHDPTWVLRHAHPRALAVNGYRDRLAATEWMDADGSDAWKLWEQLTAGPGRPYLAGVNAAAFDQFMIAKLWPGMPFADRPWRYRILDLANIGMTELGLDYLPGLSALVDLLGLKIAKPDHTAMGDVYTTTLVLVELLRRRDARLGIVRNEQGQRLCEGWTHGRHPGVEIGASVPCGLTVHGSDVPHAPAERNELGDLHPDPAAVVRTTPRRATLQS